MGGLHREALQGLSRGILAVLTIAHMYTYVYIYGIGCTDKDPRKVA